MKGQNNTGQGPGFEQRVAAHPFTHDASRVRHHAVRSTTRTSSLLPRPSARAFTLIELLIVISIMAIIAAMIFPAIRTVNRRKLIMRTRGELTQMESYINSYKAKLGHYPPDNRDPNTGVLLAGLNPLYYELAGTTNSGPNTTFGTIDRTVAMTPGQITAFFGPNVTGFINSTKPGGDEAAVAQKFLVELKPGQIADASGGGGQGRILVCTVPGTDPNVPPLVDVNNPTHPLNPWRYNSSSPTNNTTTFDLWVDIVISGVTNRICNWSPQPLILK